MNYTLLTHIMIMGIQAYIFSKRFRKDKKHIEHTESNVEPETDDKTKINSQQVVELNKRLYNMYHELTHEQDTFELKRQENTNIHEALNSKKCEVENRLLYLEGIRNKVGDKFKDGTTSIQEFKELCAAFISTHDDIEKVQMEIHQSEIELELYLQSWNAELLEHNNKVNNLRNEIETLLKEIAQLNQCNMQHT